MAGSYLGLDIGTNYLRMAVRDKALRFVHRRLPDNAINEDGVVSPQVLADFLRATLAEEQVRSKLASVVLHEGQVFFRHVSMPAMTEQELLLNLPYEFRDYITDDPAEYNYDYVVDEMVENEDGRPERMELFAAAARKDLIDMLAQIHKKAGTKLRVVNPLQMAFGALMARHVAEHPEMADTHVVLIDADYEKTSIALFGGSHFQGSRVVELGVRDVRDVVSDLRGVDSHVADSYISSNFEGVLDDAQVQGVFDRLVFEVNKVINFYNFSNPDKDISKVFLFGGGTALPQLRAAIVEGVGYPVEGAEALLPAEAAQLEESSACAIAYAGLLAGEMM